MFAKQVVLGSQFPFDEIANGTEYYEVVEECKNCTDGVILTVQKFLNSNYGANIAEDNLIGPETRKALVKGLQMEFNKQLNAGLIIDGIFGAKTKSACPNLKNGTKGNITYLVQAVLQIKGYDTNGLDGIYGSGTEKAVRRFQSNKNLSVDGIVGKNTFENLFK